ncbi:hypothetical protein N7G274_008366 [Stereocaulon virgatum]|uniref:Uncharacterized protein n=1 Tax=Stereocaulon virgatum TaxID=373712 RepID=A0ABR4A028_9LECA
MSKNQHGNRPKEGDRCCDNNRRDPARGSNDAECSKPYPVCYHALTTEGNTQQRAESQRPSNIHFSPAMQRWEEESEEQQPWLGITGSSAPPPSKGKYVAKGDAGSNSAINRNDDGKGP